MAVSCEKYAHMSQYVLRVLDSSGLLTRIEGHQQMLQTNLVVVDCPSMRTKDNPIRERIMTPLPTAIANCGCSQSVLISIHGNSEDV
ncbi:hypothetical protein TYRP_016621 [Tyrophagus putrescentiae]|nr:hypothetical protein TYRP_016621 [Tyrophagus putrescentiae]